MRPPPARLVAETKRRDASAYELNTLALRDPHESRHKRAIVYFPAGALTLAESAALLRELASEMEADVTYNDLHRLE